MRGLIRRSLQICWLLFLSGGLLAQVDQELVMKFEGGRFGFSYDQLSLFSDSTFSRSGWLHTGHTYQYEGTYQTKDSLIVLCYEVKRKKKKKISSETVCDDHRFDGSELKACSLIEEKKDPSACRDYHTLYLVSED